MHNYDSADIAKSLIRIHGPRAAAVAMERANEAQVAHDTTGLERWQAVERAIAELRRTAPAAGPA